MSSFLRNKLASLPYPSQTFAGQTIIVTGANTGLGLEAAQHFTRLHAAKVILASRSISKGEEAARSIEETTGRKGVCEVWQLDLGNFDSVKKFTERAVKLDRLDIVCENAGIAALAYKELEGMESTVAVNVVGTFLMALNFLPILRTSGKKTETVPKLVVTTSETHAWVSGLLPFRIPHSHFSDFLRKSICSEKTDIR
jgi:retinol dehydrogenase-12